LAHFRNLLIFSVSGGDLNLVEASESEAVALKEQSSRLHADALMRMLEVMTDCEGRLRDATSKKILLEVTLLKLIEARNAVSIDTVLKQVQQLRTEATGGLPRKAPASAPVAVPAAKLIPASTANVSASVAGTNLAELWPQLVEAVSRASPFVRTYFVEAHPVSFEKNVLTIGFDPEFADHLSLVDNSKNHTLVQTKLAELGHPRAQVRFIKAEAPARERVAVPIAAVASAPQPLPAPSKSAAAAAPQPFNKEDFKNDPLIREALEVFKGQIVDVRS
jgi:DNA polymerase-3 subunit gamma/tau